MLKNSSRGFLLSFFAALLLANSEALAERALPSYLLNNPLPTKAQTDQFLNYTADDQHAHVEEMPGPVSLVRLIKTYNPNQKSQVVQVLYKPNRSHGGYLLGTITSKINKSGFVSNIVIHNDNLNTYINKLSIDEFMNPEFLRARVQAIEKERWEPFKEASVKSADQSMELALFTYRGLKNIYMVYDEFDSVIDEALSVQETLDLQDPLEKLMHEHISKLIEESLDAQEAELIKAYASLAGLMTLDVVTYASGYILKPLNLAWSRLSLKMAQSKLGRVAALKAARFFARAGKVGRFTTNKIGVVGVKLGLNGLAKRLIIRIKTFKGTLYLAKYLKAGGSKAGAWFAAHPKIKKLFDASDVISLAKLTETEKRFYIAGVFYNTLYGTLINGVMRGQNVADILDNPGISKEDKAKMVEDQAIALARDSVMQLILSATVSRLTVKKVDANGTMTAFKEWRVRQFTSHVQTSLEAGILTFNVMRQTQDQNLTDEQLDYIWKRMAANFAYTMARGSFVSSANGVNARLVNDLIIKARQNGNMELVRTQLTREFLSRIPLSVFSWAQFLEYREGFAGQEHDKLKQATTAELLADLKNAIDVCKTEGCEKVLPFQPTGIVRVDLENLKNK